MMDLVKLYVQKSITENLIPNEEFHNFCDTIYILTKVRGVRTISRYCPHEVSNLEPVVMFLERNS